MCAMSAIEGIAALRPAHAVAPVMRGGQILGPAGSSADVADLSASALRVRLAGPHEQTNLLHRVVSIVDSADAALERTQALLARARSAALDGSGIEDAPLDTWLAALDEETARPFSGAPEGLRGGASLVAGSDAHELRPLAINELGAVVAAGRSHRLGDTGGGGTLDHRVNRSGALKSLDAALTEVSGVRTQLGGFRAGVIVPAQRDAVSVMRVATDTGPGTVDETTPIAFGIRSRLHGGASIAALGAHDRSRVLALLG
jgi:hypothetical protein